MGDREQELTGSLAYNSHLFDAATITRMLGHLQTVLEGIVAHPEQCLSTVPLLTASERHRLLAEWNHTTADDPQDQRLHELVEAQVERTPEAMAVVCEDGRVTYRELNTRANQLAHYLRRLGAGPDVLVGLCMERSWEMVVGLLGILKAGGAYVPLDPAYPQERLAFMMADAQIPVLLTQGRLVEGLPKHGARMICLDTDWEVMAREGQENPISSVTAENLAYVIYTSGSTGQPKGVLISHGAIVNHVRWMQAAFPLSEADCVVQQTSCSFDVSVWEFFAPFIAGARLLMARPGGHRDPAYLVKLLAEQRVTVLQLVPSMLRVFLEEGLEACTALRHVFCGGEALPVRLQERFFARLSASLHNLYGPTEATIDATCWSCTRERDQRLIPVGRPITNTRAYILDPHLQPVPVGVPGELYIGGAGLARGYLHRPDLTAEKFLPDPFGTVPGARLYRTGDVARYLPDGTIEVVGRLDHQVKIRGVRVELGEIEAVLRQHPGVRDAVVVAREETPGEKRLVAYLVPGPDHAASLPGELRLFLHRQLPASMIPSAVVLLDTFPLTPNGKVDRRALPAAAHGRPAVAEAFVAPRSPVEETVARFWSDLLGRARVGTHDNFFELGGHSLSATQVMSRVRSTFHVDLPLHRFFEAPTVAGLAACIEASRRGADGPQALPIRPVPRHGALPLSWTQERLWFLDQWEPGSVAYNIPAAFHLAGTLDVAALERSLNEIVRRHDALRTTFTAVEGRPVQVVADHLTLQLPVIDLQSLPESTQGDEVRRLTAAAIRQPFNLTDGPLLRATLLRLGEQEHVLLLVVHHIIADGWSLGVFFRELAALYSAYTTGQPSPLPELPIQYADVARWQRQCLATGLLDVQLAYWRQALADLPPLELPTDYPRPRIQTYRGAKCSVVISRHRTDALKALSRAEHATLFMTVLAAFKTLLHRYTGQDDIVLGCPIANRHRTEFEPLIGVLINTLVLRTHLSGNPSFRDVLGRVRETALQAYAHQDVPFEHLIATLQPERDPNRAPLVQVLLNFLNVPAERLELPDLTLRPMDVDNDETAKFDLTLYVAEADGELTLIANYNTDLFAAATIVRMLRHLQTLLDGIIADPGARLAALPLLTAAERQHLAAEQRRVRPTNPFVVFPKTEIEQSLAERFVKQVRRAPHAIAVKTSRETWTYDALNRGANRVAQRLLALRGAGEDRVALVFHHGAPMITALLGALKAGKTYVPLDPSYPRERLAYMLHDAQASVIVTDTTNLAAARTLVRDAL